MAKTPLTLLVLLGLLLFAYKWGSDKVTAPLGPKYVKPCVPTPITNGRLESHQITVRVLNGSRMRGKAADVAQQLRTAGFRVTKVGNAEQQSPRTQVVGFATENPEVQLVMKAFVNTTQTADHRADHSVDVIIGNEYFGMQRDIPTYLQVNEASLCLPEPPAAVE